MSEIRDRVIRQMRSIIVTGVEAEVPVGHIIRDIMAMPEIAIVDGEVELPIDSFPVAILYYFRDWDTAIFEITQFLRREGWAKEILDD